MAAFDLFMDIASGATKFPTLKLTSMLTGGILWDFWWIGSDLGLLMITAIDDLTDQRRGGA